jgi:hypothetical protein
MNVSQADDYIVRIYRRGLDMLVGVVETDVPEDCTLFHSFAELQSILAREAALGLRHDHPGSVR